MRCLSVLLLAACARPAPPATPAPPAGCPVAAVVRLPGASAEVLEDALIPMERHLLSLAGVQGVEVVVREGRADLAVRGTLGLVALRDALRAVQLPPEAEVPELRLTHETLSLVAIRARPHEDLFALGERAKRVTTGASDGERSHAVRSEPRTPRAERINQRVGGTLLAPAAAEISVRLDPHRLRALGVDLDAVLTALRAFPANQPGPGLEELGTLVLPGHPMVRLRDVATMELRRSAGAVAQLDGHPVAVLMTHSAPDLGGEDAVVFGPLVVDTCTGDVSVPSPSDLTFATLDTPPNTPIGAVDAPAWRGPFNTPNTLTLSQADFAQGRPLALTRSPGAHLTARTQPGTFVVAAGDRRVTLTLSHPDLARLGAAAEAMTRHLGTRAEVADWRVDGPESRPELSVRLAPNVDRPRILQSILAATQGLDATHLRHNQTRLPVRLYLAAPVDGLEVGGQRLADLTSLEYTVMTSRIVRSGGRRVARVVVALDAQANVVGFRAGVVGVEGVEVE